MKKVWFFIDLDQQGKIACSLLQNVNNVKVELHCFVAKNYLGPVPFNGHTHYACTPTKDAADSLFLFTLGSMVAQQRIKPRDIVYVVSGDRCWMNSESILQSLGFSHVYLACCKKDIPECYFSATDNTFDTVESFANYLKNSVPKGPVPHIKWTDGKND